MNIMSNLNKSRIAVKDDSYPLEVVSLEFLQFPLEIYNDMESLHSYIFIEKANKLLIYKNKDGGISVWDKESLDKLKNEYKEK